MYFSSSLRIPFNYFSHRVFHLDLIKLYYYRDLVSLVTKLLQPLGQCLHLEGTQLECVNQLTSWMTDRMNEWMSICIIKFKIMNHPAYMHIEISYSFYALVSKYRTNLYLYLSIVKYLRPSWFVVSTIMDTFCTKFQPIDNSFRERLQSSCLKPMYLR